MSKYPTEGIVNVGVVVYVKRTSLALYVSKLNIAPLLEASVNVAVGAPNILIDLKLPAGPIFLQEQLLLPL